MQGEGFEIQAKTDLLLRTGVQFSSVAQLCLILCDPMNCSMPGLPVHHQLPEFTQTHDHRVGDSIQPSHPLSSPSPPAPNPSLHLYIKWASLVAQLVKKYACNARDQVRSWVGKIPWSRVHQPTPVFLPGESHGQRSLGGLQSTGSRRVRHD